MDVCSFWAGLGVCIADVDLSDGLSHFNDSSSARGTMEERSLLRQLHDADPTTIEIFIIPQFAGTGRIGESFLPGYGHSLQNMIVIDRAGVHANSHSLTIAHELGHLLLKMSGHPDDYGVDRPAQLMDADSADASLFGPRRIPLEQCKRALIQTGPDSLNQLIYAHPFIALQ